MQRKWPKSSIVVIIFIIFAFWVFLILGPIASIVVLYEAQKNGRPLNSGDKGVLIVTAITWAGFIIYSLVNRGTPRSDSGGTSSYDYSSYSYSSQREVNNVPSMQQGEYNMFAGKKGEFTVIKEVKEGDLYKGSGQKECSINWEGNFGFNWECDGKILESDINGPTKIQMGDRTFVKNWGGEWKEEE